jgi:hypothetical protein
MDNLIALGGFAAVMVLSLPLALGLDWLCLRGAFLLLSDSPRHVRVAAPCDAAGQAHLSHR